MQIKKWFGAIGLGCIYGAFIGFFLCWIVPFPAGFLFGLGYGVWEYYKDWIKKKEPEELHQD